jgi:hypothetical protein
LPAEALASVGREMNWACTGLPEAAVPAGVENPVEYLKKLLIDGIDGVIRDLLGAKVGLTSFAISSSVYAFCLVVAAYLW